MVSDEISQITQTARMPDPFYVLKKKSLTDIAISNVHLIKQTLS